MKRYPPPDPGPKARWEHAKKQANTLGVVLQKIGSGESTKDIARAWAIPHSELCDWLIEQGRQMCRPVALLLLIGDKSSDEALI